MGDRWYAARASEMCIAVKTNEPDYNKEALPANEVSGTQDIDPFLPATKFKLDHSPRRERG